MELPNFQSQKLVVDYISFKFQELDNYTQTKIANYLFKIGFNSYQDSGRLAKPVKESIQVNLKNKYEVLFIKEGPYWQGNTRQFSGQFFLQQFLIDSISIPLELTK